jgi:hypothetical protein
MCNSLLVRKRTVLLRDFDRVLRLYQVRTRHHHFLHAYRAGAGDYGGEVIGMGAFAAVHTAEDWVTEVDADLKEGGTLVFQRSVGGGSVESRTNIYVFVGYCRGGHGD